MYQEFIIGYILSGVAVVLLLIVLILQCVILKKLAHGGGRPQEPTFNPYAQPSAYGGGRGTAICRNCAAQFEAVHTVCPRCGTPR